MPPKKCVSNCTKKKTIDECNADERCKYANGKVRKYCHLSTKWTFDNLCNVIHKDKNRKLPRTKSLPSSKRSPKYEEPVKIMRQTRKKTTPQPIKKINPFDLIQGYSSSNSSKQVKRTMRRKPFTIIESSDTPPVKLNPFNLIQGYSSSNSSKQVKKSMKRKHGYIIDSSSN
jgi:hypothetical protein